MLSTPADAVILDLEDAVSGDAKTTGRGHVYRHLTGSPAPDPRVIVRVNPAETRWHLDDLHAVRDGGAAWVLLPKAADATSVEQAFAVLGSGGGIIALCESAGAIMAARSTASAISCSALMWGSEDLAVDLAIAESRDERGRWSPLLEHARYQIRIAAASAGCLAIDSPCVLLNARELVQEEARSAMQAGFYAKACIHPSQVPLVRSAFRPSESRVA